MVANQTHEIASYVAQIEEVKEAISVLHKTIVDLKYNTNNKSSEEDINQLQSKILEVRDVNTMLNEEVEFLIKVETVSVTHS